MGKNEKGTKLRRIVKSKPKKGQLYLLRSTDGIFKYGATTQPINKRLAQINSKNSQMFKIVFTAASKDVFNAELYIKWELLNRTEFVGKSVEYFKLKKDDWDINNIKLYMEAVCQGT